MVGWLAGLSVPLVSTGSILRDAEHPYNMVLGFPRRGGPKATMAFVT